VKRSVDDPMEDASVNVVGTINVLEAAQAGGARRVVFASSGGAIYGNPKTLPFTERTTKRPQSPYGVSKKVAEDYLKLYEDTYGLEYTIVAPANIYGPRQDPYGEAGVVAIFIQAMLEGRRPVIYGDGTVTRDYVYVDDITDAFVRAAYKGEGKLINVGSGVETTVQEIYDLIARELDYRRRPEYASPRPGDVPRSVIDPRTAKRVLDWEAWTPVGAGIRRTVTWYRGLG
jgi:UDP-glucose 4-epimerase